MNKDLKALAEAAKPFRDGFTYDPGHSDLDNEQPIHVRVTLGDWRRLHWVLQQAPDSYPGTDMLSQRLNAYVEAFAADDEGLTLTPDTWNRLRADIAEAAKALSSD